MKHVRNLLIVLAIVIFSLVVYAGFGYYFSPSKVEDSISSNYQISALDDQLEHAFSQLKNKLSWDEFEILLKGQRKWIADRNSRCENGWDTTDDCLVESYEIRIKTLDAISRGMLPALTELNTVCSEKGQRNWFKGPVFDDGFNPNTVAKRALLDINNDGADETIENCSSGTMRLPCMTFKDQNGEEIYFNYINYQRGDQEVTSTQYFEYNGKNYQYNWVYGDSKNVVYVTPDNHRYTVCKFENIDLEEFSATTNSSDAQEICSLASRNKLNYVGFTGKPSISLEQFQAARGSEGSIQAQKVIDINNDGEKELIAQVDYDSDAGRGCKFLYYDELNLDGKSFKSSTEAKTPLLKMQRVSPGDRHPACGGKNNRLFEFKDKIYYEINTSWEHHISILNGNEISKICDVKRTTKTNVTHIGPQ